MSPSQSIQVFSPLQVRDKAGHSFDRSSGIPRAFGCKAGNECFKNWTSAASESAQLSCHMSLKRSPGQNWKSVWSRRLKMLNLFQRSQLKGNKTERVRPPVAEVLCGSTVLGTRLREVRDRVDWVVSMDSHQPLGPRPFYKHGVSTVAWCLQPSSLQRPGHDFS